MARNPYPRANLIQKSFGLSLHEEMQPWKDIFPNDIPVNKNVMAVVKVPKPRNNSNKTSEHIFQLRLSESVSNVNFV